MEDLPDTDSLTEMLNPVNPLDTGRGDSYNRFRRKSKEKRFERVEDRQNSLCVDSKKKITSDSRKLFSVFDSRFENSEYDDSDEDCL